MKDKITCSVCLTSYNSKDHVPLVLICGHNICSIRLNDLYNENTKTLKCHYCRKENNYN